MAGGDYALIKSVESFEDREDFGVRQLEELGFTDADLLLGLTEGGETSFVLGTINHAKKLSKKNPYFIYCNPDNELKTINRSNLLIEDSNIKKLNLTIGEMALSGSTRMQATTVQMLSCGVALFNNFESKENCKDYIEKYCSSLLNLNVLGLKPFVTNESLQYKKGGVVTYVAERDIAIAVMTDTTERSPTFNLPGFEKENETDLSMSYLCVKESEQSKSAWSELLGRAPRALEWDEAVGRIDLEQVYRFDISEKSNRRREVITDNETFQITSTDKKLSFELQNEQIHFDLDRSDLLFKHLSLKILLNIHSTLVMGILNRYEDNMMTYVRASNLKLVDRTIRYAQQLLKKHNIEVDDSEMARFIFDHKDEPGPIVIKLRDYYLKRV